MDPASVTADSSCFTMPGISGSEGSRTPPPQNPFVSIWSVDTGAEKHKHNMTLQYNCDNGNNSIRSYIPPPMGAYLNGFGNHAGSLANSVMNSPTTPTDLIALLNEMTLDQGQYVVNQEEPQPQHQGFCLPDGGGPMFGGPGPSTTFNGEFPMFSSDGSGQGNSTLYINGQATPPNFGGDVGNANNGCNFVFANQFQADSTPNFQCQSAFNFENVSIPTPPWDVNNHRSDMDNFSYHNGNNSAGNGGIHINNSNDFSMSPGMPYPQGPFNQFENFGPSSTESVHMNNGGNVWRVEVGPHPEQAGNYPIYDNYSNNYRDGNDRQRRSNVVGGGGRRRRQYGSKSRQTSAENGFNNNNMRLNNHALSPGSNSHRFNGPSNQNGCNMNRESDISHCDNPDSPDSIVDTREVGIVDKLLHSYGFIRCPVSQCRLFFHFSHYDGNIEHLKQGDTVEFDRTYDRKTSKPVAVAVVKLSASIVKDDGERLIGTVTSELTRESNGKLRGRVSYEYNGECFFLPFGKEDVEGQVSLCVGDTVSFQIEVKNRNGGLVARFVQLECSAKSRLHNGFVVCVCDDFGFIQRVDVPKKIHYQISGVRSAEELEIGDYVQFNISTNNAQEQASNITKVLTPPIMTTCGNGNKTESESGVWTEGQDQDGQVGGISFNSIMNWLASAATATD